MNTEQDKKVLKIAIVAEEKNTIFKSVINLFKGPTARDEHQWKKLTGELLYAHDEIDFG